jgi:hypothetical protein
MAAVLIGPTTKNNAKCTFISHENKAGQNHDMEIHNKPSERVEQFKYL